MTYASPPASAMKSLISQTPSARPPSSITETSIELRALEERTGSFDPDHRRHREAARVHLAIIPERQVASSRDDSGEPPSASVVVKTRSNFLIVARLVPSSISSRPPLPPYRRSALPSSTMPAICWPVATTYPAGRPPRPIKISKPATMKTACASASNRSWAVWSASVMSELKSRPI